MLYDIHTTSDHGGNQRGFTIVELLVVIVVIGILAAITIVSYSGIQDRGRMVKIQADISQLNTAILSARAQTDKALGAITGSFSTVLGCSTKVDGTNLATLPTSDSCWTQYNSALDKISIASSINVRGLLDPWGRPYSINENETESGGCTKDAIGAFTQPFITGWQNFYPGTTFLVDNSAPGC